ncbi:hypothetical protein L6R53_20375 [Myxococcota bacterium]|nr:hypothetical protein [Myxococcota bacterium]
MSGGCGRRGASGLLLLALVGCGRSSADPLDRLRAHLAPPEPRGPPLPAWGPAWQGPGYTVRPLSLEAQPGLRVGAALFAPDGPGADAVLLTQGHFGGGKSTPQVQQLAHRLAAEGLTVLAVDSPGEEEWARDPLVLHFGRGAHNRAFLHAGGSSPLALMLAGLQGGLDLLEERGATRVLASGASGGAVQAFWLAVLDPRVQGVVLAAVPDIPRHPGTAGCGCTALPGLSGPDPAVLAVLPVPSLWLSERPEGPPAGLPAHATWRHVEGPHDYTVVMQRQARDWILDRLDRSPGPWIDTVPALDLRLAGPQPEGRGVQELHLRPADRWSPSPVEGAAWSVACVGEGPTVVLAGAGGPPGDAAGVAGHRVCRFSLEDPPTAVDEARVQGQVYADRVAGALRAAAAQEGATTLWGVGGWSVAVAGAGLPCRLWDPPRRPEQVDPAADPAWLHVPGLWWGLADELYARCGRGAQAERPDG